MADNVAITAGSGVNVAADEATYSGDTAKVQLVRLVHVTGSEGSKTVEELVKAEDAAHSTGDNGIMMLSVRQDTAAALGGTDADYQPLITDANGRLHVLDANSAAIKTAVETLVNAISGTEMQVDVVAALPAGDNNIGNVDIVTMPNVTLAAGTNTNEVVGDVAHGSPVGGNPLLQGAEARTTNPTAVADGDVVRLQADDTGKLVTTALAPRDLEVHEYTTITSSTSETTILAAGAAGVFHDVKAIIVTNTSATDTELTIKDATAGTTRLQISCPANDTRGVVFHQPLKQATAANNWTGTAADSVASLNITVQGIKNV